MFENITNIVNHENVKIKIETKIKKPENVISEIRILVGDKIVATFKNDDEIQFSTDIDVLPSDAPSDSDESSNKDDENKCKDPGWIALFILAIISACFVLYVT